MIRLTDLLFEAEDWCNDPQFQEFADYLAKWQSHATYRSVRINDLIKSFNKLDSKIQKAISATPQEIKSSYSALDMDAMWNTNKVKVVSFTEKKAAMYFSKQLTGNPVVSGKFIKNYTLAISYPRVVKLCGREVNIGDDEGEILIVEPEFDKRFVKDYWEDQKRSSEVKQKARENLNNLSMNFFTIYDEVADKFGIDSERDNYYRTTYSEDILNDFKDEISIYKQVEDDNYLYEEDFKKIKSYILKLISKYESKSKQNITKRFFKELKKRTNREIELEHPNASREDLKQDNVYE